MGDERLQALVQESLHVAVKTGTDIRADFTPYVVDTTVAEKNVVFPTDAKLIHKARERLVKQAKTAGIDPTREDGADLSLDWLSVQNNNSFVSGHPIFSAYSHQALSS